MLVFQAPFYFLNCSSLELKNCQGCDWDLERDEKHISTQVFSCLSLFYGLRQQASRFRDSLSDIQLFWHL